MKILIDIGHPAHVHLFKNFAWEMNKKGHSILFTCREKEFETELLNYYGFSFKSFGKKYTSKIGKLLGLIEFDFKEFVSGLRFKPDLFLSHGSMYAAHAAFLLRKPHISMEDTFNFEQIRLYLPFTNAVLTSTYNHPDLGSKNLRYSGYHELAYLHPHYFKPEEGVLKLLNLKNDERFCIIRFVSWKATHDSGHKGMSMGNKLNLIQNLSKYLKVFISSEVPLPAELLPYKFPLSPSAMHDVIAFSSLVFGESATMVSEGAMLGVPGIYLDNTGRYYTTELEQKYGLVYNFTESASDQLKAIDKALGIVISNNKAEWKQKQEKLLKEKINTTSFLVWFIENWPDSFRVMKENPKFQERFQ